MTALLGRSAAVSLAKRRGQARDTAADDEWLRFATAMGLWIGLLLVTAWWTQDGGLRELTTWSGVLTSLGRLTGLVASLLLLCQTLSMARIPRLEQAFGQDRIAVMHRVLGFWSFNLMMAHIGLITWGYAAGDLLAVPGEAWNLTTTYPGMLLAGAGTACLVGVVVTSVKAARRRLRYESWQLIHLYAYLGVGLALPHQLWTGQQFTSSPTRTAFWWGLWIAAVVAVLIWRVGLPLWRSLRHQLRVTSVVAEGRDVWSVYFTGRHLDELPVTAGQFLSWRFLGRPGQSRAHPYSLSAAPDGRSLRITVKGLGDGSLDVGRLTPGTRAAIEGPFGRLTDRARRRDKVALIGAGVGITPLRALLEATDSSDVIYIERFRDAPLFVDEVNQLARERSARVLRLGGPRRAPDAGGRSSWLCDGFGPAADSAVLLHYLPDVADRDVYVCGPSEWAESLRHTLSACGVPSDQIHLETYTW